MASTNKTPSPQTVRRVLARHTVWVYPDNGIYKKRAVALAPVIGFATLLFACRLAVPHRGSAGAGWWAFPTVAAAVLVPLIWTAAFMVLRRLNARIVLDDGVLYVRNSLRRWILSVDTNDITGLHPVDVRVSDQTRPDRVIITSRDNRPCIIDTRIWQPNQIRLLWNRLGAPTSAKQTLPWKELPRDYPGVRMPWLQVHPGSAIALGTIATIACIVLVVQVAFMS
jgi:hypothetical protein